MADSVSSGQVSSGIILSNKFNVYSGGTADGFTIDSGGRLHVWSGGTAVNIYWTPCIGHFTIEDGAAVTFATKLTGVYFGKDDCLLSSAASMSGKIVSGANKKEDESMFVMSGGTVTDTTATGYGSIDVWSGGQAYDTTLSDGGELAIYSSGTADNVTVNQSGWMTVYSGGIVNRTTVNDGGELAIYGDGTDDALLSDGTNLGGWQIVNGQRAGDYWFGPLNGWQYVGVGDYDLDGTDDILVSQDNEFAVWTVKNGSITGSIAIA